MRVFSVFACIAFSLAALIIFCAFPLSASALLSDAARFSANLGPQPKVAVLPSPQPKVLVVRPIPYLYQEISLKLRQPVVDKDVPALAVEADKGDPVAQTRLGFFLVADRGDADKVQERRIVISEIPMPKNATDAANKDREHGVALLRKAADQGLAEAQYLYAVFTPHAPEALSWLQKAAEQNFAPAAAAMAVTPKERDNENLAEKVFWLRKAVAMGDAPSAEMLGELYLDYDKIEYNAVVAYTWLYLARHGFSQPVPAGPKNNDPLNYLGWTITLEEGRQVEKALAAWPKTLPPEAPTRKPVKGFYEECNNAGDRPDIPALEAKATSGDNTAKIQLGKYYYGDGVDTATSLALFKEVADAGDVRGLRMMAFFYADLSLSNPGLERKDMDKAQEVYEKLAKTGNAIDQSLLGNFLLHNKWEKSSDHDRQNKDNIHETVLKWLTKATDQEGSSEAMFALGNYYYGKSDYKATDTKNALIWYTKAANSNYIPAIYSLASLAERNGDAAGAYKWMSIWMGFMPARDRWRMQGMMIMCLSGVSDEYLIGSGLPDEKVLQMKEEADKWLKAHPDVQKANAERLARIEACYQAKAKEEESKAGNK